MIGQFTIRFLGVRGSYAVPGPKTTRFGGNTPCIDVHVGGHRIVLDAGTGIIGLGSELVEEYFARPAATRGRLHCTILLSHMHHDHIQGYPFFAPLYLAQTTVHVFGPRMLREDLASALSGAMVAPYFPVDADEVSCERHIRTIEDRDAIVFPAQPTEHVPRVVRALELDVETPQDQVVVTCYHSLNHPRGGSFVYRLDYAGKRLVFATDTEGYVGGDQRLIKFARGADLLVHDAAYRSHEYLANGKQGWGHSTIEMAVDVARQAEARRLVLFHHSPTNDDETLAQMEREAQALLPGTVAAYEGLVVDL